MKLVHDFGASWRRIIESHCLLGVKFMIIIKMLVVPFIAGIGQFSHAKINIHVCIFCQVNRNNMQLYHSLLEE